MKSLSLVILMAAIATISQGLYYPEISSELEGIPEDEKPTQILHQLNKRYADPQEPSEIIESDEPTDRILMRFSKGEDVAEVVNEDYQVQKQEGRRHKRRTRAVLIRICNRRTRRCKNILIVRRS